MAGRPITNLSTNAWDVQKNTKWISRYAYNVGVISMKKWFLFAVMYLLKQWKKLTKLTYKGNVGESKEMYNITKVAAHLNIQIINKWGITYWN